MRDPKAIDRSELPTIPSLHKASAAAVVGVALLAVIVVLPAERGIDPTGIGALMGLTALGELKNTREAPDSDAPYAPRSDVTELTLKPGQSLEMKVKMRGGDTLDYAWTATGGELYFDFHGEEKGKPSSEFVSYEKATKGSAADAFEVPFEGTHGWYWKNKTEQTVQLQLKTQGPYIDLKRM